MWRLLNKLLGWDYVYVNNGVASKICRVKNSPNGERYFQPYSFQINIIPEPIKVTGVIIKGWAVVPLTHAVTLYD